MFIILCCQDDVQETLGLKVLENDATEGIDYIREKWYFIFLTSSKILTCYVFSVPIELKLELRLPTTCVWLHTDQRAEPCYLQPEVFFNTFRLFMLSCLIVGGDYS